MVTFVFLQAVSAMHCTFASSESVPALHGVSACKVTCAMHVLHWRLFKQYLVHLTLQRRYRQCLVYASLQTYQLGWSQQHLRRLCQLSLVLLNVMMCWEYNMLFLYVSSELMIKPQHL